MKRWPTATAALLGLGLAIALGLEVLARIRGVPTSAALLLPSVDALPDGWLVTDRTNLATPTPGFEGRFQGIETSAVLRFDDQGLRGGPPENDKRPRWLVSGGTIALAPQVAEEHTFTQLLGDRSSTRILNGGVPGWSTWQATRQYLRVDDTLKIERWILLFDLGETFLANERFPREAMTAPSTSGTPITRSPNPTLNHALARHLRLYTRWWVGRVDDAVRAGRSPLPDDVKDAISLFNAAGAGRLAQLLPQTSSALDEFQRAARTRGEPITVVLVPPGWVVQSARRDDVFRLAGLDPAGATLEAPVQAVQEMLARYGVPACNLTPALVAAHEKEENLYFAWDGYWTPEGHRVVADALSRCLVSSGGA